MRARALRALWHDKHTVVFLNLNFMIDANKLVSQLMWELQSAF